MKPSRLFMLFMIPVMCSGCVSQEIKSLGNHMLNNLLFIVPFAAGLIILTFLMNKLITRRSGGTHERACSVVGVILFPIIFLVVLSMKFGFGWITVAVSLVIGGLLGWFSYTTDELMLSFWENRRVTIPATLGILMGSWMFVNVFTHVWLQGDMYITQKACARRVVVERYTYHYSTDSEGNDDSYYSWDYHSSSERFASGSTPPVLVEGRDYRLGKGALGRRDRVGREEVYQFIGGYLFSEKRRLWTDFRWLRLMDPRLQFETGRVQRVQSNFYGNPIKNGGDVNGYMTLPNPASDAALPTVRDLPPAQGVVKVMSMSYNFIKMLIIEDEYRPILYLHIAGVLLLGLLALIPGLRVPVLIFVLCSLIVIPIILLMFAARTGSIPGLGGIGRRRKAGGGGGFMGRSASM